ncbi:MAG: helix-turn-helix domain-containing protein [Acidothermaceae bacterium]
MSMMSMASDQDVRGLIDVITASHDDPVPVGLPQSAFNCLAKLISCDQISLFELDSRHQTIAWAQSLLPEDDDDEADKIFWSHYWDCRACSYPDYGDDRSVTTFADFYNETERCRIGMYSEYLSPYGVENDLMLVLPIRPRESVRLEFFRGPGPDFTERDRAILFLLRPHLREIYAAQRADPQLPSLTERQLELVELVAQGRTNGQIARHLGISEGTVRKHLENIFERLGVNNRTAAVLRMFPRQTA